jgi:hypothetical protein
MQVNKNITIFILMKKTNVSIFMMSVLFNNYFGFWLIAIFKFKQTDKKALIKSVFELVSNFVYVCMYFIKWH